MGIGHAARRAAAAGFCAWAALACHFAAAQDAPAIPDPLDQEYATGLLQEDPAVYRSFDRAPIYRGFLPVSVDLSGRFPPPGNQGALGSCTGWAVAYAARSYEGFVVEARRASRTRDIVSPIFVYNAIRAPGRCVGTRPSDALDLLMHGALSLAQSPATDACLPKPAASEIAQATDFRIAGWRTVDFTRPDDIKGQLAARHPVIIAMQVTRDFKRLRGNTIYRGTGKVVGGHAIVVVGYDDRRQAFKLINSWGRGWGAGGFGWISYDAFRSVVGAAYVMDVQPPAPTPRPEPPAPPPPVVPVEQPECSAISENTENGVIAVSGFVPDQATLDKVKARYAGRSARFSVDLRPWPQCEALLTLAKPLAAADRPQAALGGGKDVLAAGDPLVINVSPPSLPSFVYVSYIQADGSVVHLSQPALPAPPQALPGKPMIFGDGKDGRDRFTIGPPYGNEMVVVLAARSPLFDKPLVDGANERDYLSEVRKALLYKPDPNLPDRVAAAAVIPIRTMETSP